VIAPTLSDRARSGNFGKAVSEFPVVVIGASAGGLEAIKQLFSGIPPDTGMAFVVIQHLDPGRPSMLSSVLAGDVRMPVTEVTGQTRVEPNRVYVIPPDADLTISRELISLVPRQRTRKLHLPIDTFCRALAKDVGGRAIGVVLSGSASDGTEGLRAIKAAGGITFAQSPASAQFSSMPESSISAGVADFCLPPEGIARELVRLCRDAYLAPGLEDQSKAASDDDDVAEVLAALRQHTHLDFRAYKRSTIRRRIGRRMALRGLVSQKAYAEALRNDAGESRELAQDMLINVTEFFRDADAFEALKQQVLPRLLEHKNEDGEIRVWVAGCSTGQEAYSLGMLLIEYLDDQKKQVPVKIFGSDLSERAVATARAGLYGEADLEGVSPERLARFFERSEGRYRIGKRIRDLCVFVRHDLTQDPPFARLDLVSCRNILIYFDGELQHRILPLLHYCLNEPGYLFLGSSESIREFDDLFTPVDNKHRIFEKTGKSRGVEYPMALGREAESRLPAFQPAKRPQPARDAQRQADHLLLARYAPPGVVVDERLEVVQFRGHTGAVLAPPPGQPQTNVVKLARHGLAGPLRDALEFARAENVTVRKHGVRITGDAQARAVDIEVTPLMGVTPTAERYFLILFEEATAEPDADVTARPRTPRKPAHDEEVARLREELAAAADYLQAVLGEHHDTMEELGAANEELVSANEELQSTNEELQSAKEELHSANEELTTLNDELGHRNQDLDTVANDLVNILESVQIPLIMVDEALRVRRFTPTAREVSSLQLGDVGRLLDDVKFKVRADDLLDRVREGLQSHAPREFEIQATDGRWFRLHIRPYRTSDGRLEGAILSFLDIDALKRALGDAEHARDYAQSIVETVPTSLVVIDANLRVVSANPPFNQAFGAPPKAAAQRKLFELAGGALDTPPLREATEQALASRTHFQAVEVDCTLPNIGRRDLVIAGCPIQGAEGAEMVLLAIEDITERRQLERSEKEARVEAENANRAKDLFLATLSHELRTPLGTIMMAAQLLGINAEPDSKVQHASKAIERAVANQSRLIDDLLDISRIVSGKLMLDLQAVDLTTVVQDAVTVAEPSAEAKGIAITLSAEDDPLPVYGDPTRLNQVVSNLLNNAIKFTPSGGRIGVSLASIDGRARIVVSDTGIGIPSAVMPHLFDRFVQADSAMNRSYGGLGLGLAIVRHLVEVHGGEVRADSDGKGHGATFTVTLPQSAHAFSREPAIVKRTVSRSIRGVRVLLVEDDDDGRVVCAAMLEEQGADVRAAGSVAEALAMAMAFAPQVILCDIAMPGEDGYAFIRKLRRTERGRQTPIAALTALAGEVDRRRTLEAGFQLHLTKPIDAEQLATAVATLVAANRAGESQNGSRWRNTVSQLRVQGEPNGRHRDPQP
jgi:two-component system, chemotaxis family, CheB/CheR fusion protein